MNILILTRITNKNGNSIYNSYTQGITNNYPNAIVMDYFNLYFEKGKSGFEQSILETITTHHINLLFINFVSGDLTFDIAFLERLCKQCFIMMNFYDTELFFEPIDRYYAQCADLVLLPTASYFTHSYSLLGIPAISTLSLFDSTLYKKQTIIKDIDVSFVGDVSKKSRRDFIEYLRLKGYQVEVFGHGTVHGNISFEKMIEIFNRSKINLNFSDTIDERMFNTHSNTDYSLVPNIMRYMTQIKGRSIEIALCGGFILSQHATGIEELFNAQEIALFKSKEELAEKIAFYLKEECQRVVMSKNAHQRALKDYDSTKAFARLFSTLSLQKTPKIVYTDKAFLSHYATSHALYLFNFLFKLKFSYAWEEFKLMRPFQIHFNTFFSHLKQQFYYQVIRKWMKR